MRKPTIWAITRYDTNRPVQSQAQVRSLKFWILVEEKLLYLCSENKGADQFRKKKKKNSPKREAILCVGHIVLNSYAHGYLCKNN